MSEGESARLRADYEHIGLSGRKVLPTSDSAEDAAWWQALDRLVEAGLANVGRAGFSLQRPEHATVQLSDADIDVLKLVYETWLRAGTDTEADETLWGEVGWWQHWWNVLSDASAREDGPLRMDTVMDDTFGQRAWLTEARTDLVGHVLDGKRIVARVIVSPSVIESPAEGFIDLFIGAGISEVRVLSDTTPYTIYGDATAVLTEAPGEEGEECYRLTRRSSVVSPLRALFELQWQSAVPWRHYLSGTGGILHLLARGWNDDRIAAALHVSGRTLTRRIATLMEATGTRTRFELGMRYARSGLDPTTYAMNAGRPQT